MIRREQITVTGAEGGSGSATATAFSSRSIVGMILSVHVEYTDSPPATTDVTIQEANNDPAMSILTLSNANSDGWFHPVVESHDTDGGELSGRSTPIAVTDTVQVTIAQANDGDGVIVTIIYDDGS